MNKYYKLEPCIGNSIELLLLRVLKIFQTTIVHHLVIDPLLKSHDPTPLDPTQSYTLPFLQLVIFISTLYIPISVSDQLTSNNLQNI